MMDTAAAILFFQSFSKTSIMANGKIICRSPSVFTICYLDLKNVPKKLRPREAPYVSSRLFAEILKYFSLLILPFGFHSNAMIFSLHVVLSPHYIGNNGHGQQKAL